MQGKEEKKNRTDVYQQRERAQDWQDLTHRQGYPQCSFH